MSKQDTMVMIRNMLKSRRFMLFGIIVLASILMHLILRSDISGSALLYVGIPTLIAGLLLLTTKDQDNPSWKAQFGRVARYSLIIMLASSALLFEGFVCVVMFMPIYFGVILIVFLIKLAYEHNKSRHQLHLHILPLLLLVAALEGIHPDLSFERYNAVTSTRIVDGNITAIKAKLQQPVSLEQQRHWFLAQFPMPYQVDAGSLNEGDIHTVHYRFRN